MKSFSSRSILSVIFITILASSCSYKQFFAAVTSRGSVPDEKTYYISHDMGADVDYLEFKDYCNLLNINLNELGYTKTDKSNAYLDVHLNYYLGSKEVVSTTASHSNYNVTSTTWNAKSNSTTNANASGSAIGFSDFVVGSASGTSNTNTNTQVKKNAYSYGGGSTTTTTESGCPCYLVLEAFNTVNNLPEWKVEVEGFIQSPSDLPQVMPWMMLVAKWHVGKSYSGKVEVETKAFLDKNLPDVFDSDTWSLQYKYFGYTDVIYREEPTK